MPESARERVTLALRAAAGDGPGTGEELLPLVYEELRNLARIRMAELPPGNTLQATALVHEAYLKLVASEDRVWSHRRHFFSAAAKAMRQILVDQARRHASLKRGGDRERVALEAEEPVFTPPPEEVLAVHEVVKELDQGSPRQAEIVQLLCFGGLSQPEAAELLDMPITSLRREWRFLRALIQTRLAGWEDAG